MLLMRIAQAQVLIAPTADPPFNRLDLQAGVDAFHLLSVLLFAGDAEFVVEGDFAVRWAEEAIFIQFG